MHRWAAILWVSGLGAFACGPANNALGTAGASDGEATAAGTTAAGTTAGGEPLNYDACSEPPYASPDVIESPDTARFAELLQQAMVDAGFGGAARVEHSQMVSNTGVRFCAQVSVRSHWYAATDYSCFEHGSDDEMRALFAAYLAKWQPLPATMISLEEVERIVNGCFAGIYHGYEPCQTRPWAPYTFHLTYNENRWVDACTLEIDEASVDLVTGALLTCETRYGGGGCEEEG